MKFKREAGGIVSCQKNLICVTNGEIASVEFPAETIMSLHKLSPGYIYTFSHVHPPNMPALSNLDKNMFRTWCFLFYPFSLRMTTITLINGRFVETCYLGILESKMEWKRSGEKKRKFEIIKEYETSEFPDDWYGWALIERSYEKEVNTI